GKVTKSRYMSNCPGDPNCYEHYTVDCSTCDGTGAVIEESKWIERYSISCSTCKGTGKVDEDYVSEQYPSGKPARYRKKRVTCKDCSGRGKHNGGGYYSKSYRPDYNARKGGGGCFITSACLANMPTQDAERALT